jgi:hypothetical protein
MLRKAANPSRSGDVWVDGHICVQDSEQVLVVGEEGIFAWVRLATGKEGYLKKEHLGWQ